MGRDLAWLRLCIASYSQSPLTSPDVSLFLFFLFSTFPLSSRPFPFRRSSWLTTERCAFVAPTIALPISVITVCETRVRLLLFFLFVSVLSSPIVLACPSSTSFFFTLSTLHLTFSYCGTDTAKSAFAVGERDCDAATLIYKCRYFPVAAFVRNYEYELHIERST